MTEAVVCQRGHLAECFYDEAGNLTATDVLPADMKTRIADEWQKFADVAREKGTDSGIKYSFTQDITVGYNGYKVVASNMTLEMIDRILSTIE